MPFERPSTLKVSISGSSSRPQSQPQSEIVEAENVEEEEDDNEEEEGDEEDQGDEGEMKMRTMRKVPNLNP